VQLHLDHVAGPGPGQAQRPGHRAGAPEPLQRLVDVHAGDGLAPAQAGLGQAAQGVGGLDDHPLAVGHLGQRLGPGVEEQGGGVTGAETSLILKVAKFSYEWEIP
jgi:hypothetical protein